MSIRRPRAVLAATVAALALASSLASAATAAEPRPIWHIDAQPAPTILQPGHTAIITLNAVDIGAGAVRPPATLTDLLPAGLTVTGTLLQASFYEHKNLGPCTTSPHAAGATLVSCTYEPPPPLTGLVLPAFESLEVRITVSVAANAGPPPLPNLAVVQGGGAAKPAEDPKPLRIGAEPTPFHIERYTLAAEREDGSTDTQAGSHPFQLTTDLGLNETLGTLGGPLLPAAPELLRDVQVTLPPGLVGDPSAVPRCTDLELSTAPHNTDQCPQNTAIGVANVTLFEPQVFQYVHRSVPVFNVTPAPGEPARFGFEVLKDIVVVDTAVLDGNGYNAVASVHNASQLAQVLASTLTLWGEPGNPVHDPQRGWRCLLNGEWEELHNTTHEHCGAEVENAKGELEPVHTSFLQMPTDCRNHLDSTALVDSWANSGPEEPDRLAAPEPSEERWKAKTFEGPVLEGCEKLTPLFTPSIAIQPETTTGNTPTGGNLVVELPQSGTIGTEHEGVAALSTPAVREATVTMPEGVLISPAAATGLEACSEGLVGFTGKSETEDQRFTPTIPEAGELEPGVNFCPNGAKIGSVTIKTPDLPGAIEGGQPERPGGLFMACSTASPAGEACPDPSLANPFGSTYAVYMIARDPASKVTVKLSGKIDVNAVTGQIKVSFKDTPEVPFERLTVHLFGGPRAAFTTPAKCGTYTVTSTFVPTSAGDEPALSEVATPSGSFSVTNGAEGSGCPSELPLTPGFSAATTSHEAGGYTDFETTISHPDADTPLTALTMKLPAGVAAMLSSVELCAEAQAQQGTCGPNSLIGEATAASGLGSDPFTATSGKVYITGPYNGAPFGLSVVIPAKAGPFDFGQVVTRASLTVDPTSAQVTITSALPTFLNTSRYQTGAPVQLKAVHVVVNRPDFQFNPTHCTSEPITGTLTGADGLIAPLSANFQSVNCGALPFGPILTVSTTGTYSRVNGTELRVAVTARPGEANVAKTRLVIPEQLPSRQTTLEKACLAATFTANPASCSPESVIGYAIVHTPVLRSPLSGPAYLVSHGGAAFPDVEFVLQGEGVLLIMDGQTNVHNGVTTSTFNAVPDAPFSSFEAIFPTGPHSILTAYSTNGSSICGEHLTVPTTIMGQNGKLIERMTPLQYTGCGKGSVAHSHTNKESALQKALKRCRHKYRHNGARRARCEAAARRRYAIHAKHTHSRTHGL